MSSSEKWLLSNSCFFVRFFYVILVINISFILIILQYTALISYTCILNFSSLMFNICIYMYMYIHVNIRGSIICRALALLYLLKQSSLFRLMIIDQRNWRCPTCQEQYSQIPNQYRCFCGKIRDPVWNKHDTPHSCGEICGKQRDQNCNHPCNEYVIFGCFVTKYSYPCNAIHFVKDFKWQH